MEIPFRTAYGPKLRVQKDFTNTTSMTKQSHKEDSDINRIMAKFLKTGIQDHVNSYAPVYGFATSETYHESLQVIETANNMFKELPAAARKKFNNSPTEFLDFVQDEANVPYLYDLGLSNTPYYPPVDQEVDQVVISEPVGEAAQ